MIEGKLLAVDFSSVMGAYLHLPDDEFGEDLTFEGEKWHIPSIETCMERFQYSVSNLDIPTENFIVVCDPGGLCKQRSKLLPNYKIKDRKAPPEFKEARKTLFEEGVKWLKSEGANVATPKNGAEADDLINELAKRFGDKVVIWTRDKDLLACPTDVLYQGYDGLELNPLKFPVEDEHIHVYRAIVLGDSSDNVGSCKGFGEKTWEKMINKYGYDSVQDLKEMFEDEDFSPLKDHVEAFPYFQKIIDQAADIIVYYKVMNFIDVPSHRVKWEGGMKMGTDTLVTADNFDKVYNLIKNADYEYATIDYEGDTCEESREWCKLNDLKVDVMGQEITGMGLRIHSSNWYFSVDHADTNNITLVQLESILELLWGKRIYAHNASFEQTLTYNHFEALMPNVEDTGLMASYVDENDYMGLKHLSSRWLEYAQASYEETLDGKSGMREISGVDVLRYGLDDVITTDSLARLFIIIMMYENTYHVFQKVENDALYFTTRAFVEGVEFDAEWHKKLEDKNNHNIKEAWKNLSGELLALGWEGGVFRPIKGLNMPAVNKVHLAVHGFKLKETAVAKAIKTMEDRRFAELLENKDLQGVNELYRKYWEPEAELNVRSPTQMVKLLYEVLELPIRIRHPPTTNMKKAGKKGNPAANDDAINNAVAWNDKPEHNQLLKALQAYKGYLTLDSLFFSVYPNLVHWKTGKIHANLRQSGTNTRRFSCSAPNLQQLPKRKGKEVRNMIKAKKGYTLLALDFTGQELRLSADDSRDENFLACYIGDNKKDPHSLTGLRIANNDDYPDVTYEEFIQAVDEEDKIADDFRTTGKKINFTAQYGAMAPKVAFTLCIKEEDAQKYLDARAEAFPGVIKRVKEWHKICKKRMYALTMLGARRHLHGHRHYRSTKKNEVQAADRLAYSMRIQGSAAEQTKRAMGEMEAQGCFDDGLVIPAMQIHDELVLQVRDDVVRERLPLLVAIMCQQYGAMIVPMETEPEVGKHFGELKRIKM